MTKIRKMILRILFFLGVFLFLSTYLIDPYTVHDGNDIVIDDDIIGFLKMLYAITSILFGCLSFLFLKFLKNKFYLISSLILVIINLIFLGKMFLYFDKFLN